MTSESGKEAPTPLLSSVTSSLMTESKAQRQQMVTKEQDRKRVVTPVPGGLPRLVPHGKESLRQLVFLLLMIADRAQCSGLNVWI